MSKLAKVMKQGAFGFVERKKLKQFKHKYEKLRTHLFSEFFVTKKCIDSMPKLDGLCE